MALRTHDDTTPRTRSTRRRLARSFGVVGVSIAAIASLGACTPQESINHVFGPLAGQATAIAKCESNLNPGAVSRTNDHGLFQINAVHKASFTRVTGQPWSAVYDPYWNAVFAKRLHSEQGWRPWTCRYVLGL